MEKSLRVFGWEGLQAERLNSLSMSEVRQMLRDVAWREAMDSWKEEARSHSKLAEVQKLIEKGYEASVTTLSYVLAWQRRGRN